MFLSLKLIKKRVKCLYTYIELKIICKYKIDLHRKSRGRLSEWEGGGAFNRGACNQSNFCFHVDGLFNARAYSRGGGGLSSGFCGIFD